MITNTLAKLSMGFAFAICLALASKLPLQAEQVGYFLMGIVTAGVFAFIWTRFVTWASAGGRPGQPQTIRLHTEEMPSQITWAAIRATLILMLVCLILFVAFVLIMTNVLGIDLVNGLRSIFGM